MTERRKKDTGVEVLYGKVPPQALDLEEAVLGAIMIDRDVVTDFIDQIKPELFYNDRNGLVCSAIIELYKRNQPIDLLTVTDMLRNQGKLEEAGGVYYITSLTNRVASAAHAEHHIKIITQKYLARQLITISTKTVSEAYDDTIDVFELLHSAESQLFNISDVKSKQAVRISDIFQRNIEKVKEIMNNPEMLTGIPSGLLHLDRVTGGWQNSDLIILAARTSMGKTSLAITVAANSAFDFNIPTAIFSLEMSSEQIGVRILSQRVEIGQELIRRGKTSQRELDEMEWFRAKNMDAPIYIDDTPALNVYEFRSKARRLKIKQGVKLIIVDYLQLMTVARVSGQSKEAEVSEISAVVKATAKELNIPIIALAQLNRKVEERGGGKTPMLSDLRSSGSIEQDADLVLFIHRPEYYGIEVDEDGNSTKGVADIIIAKHRSGSLETIKTSFIDRLTLFRDYGGDQRLTPIIKNEYAKKDDKEIEENLPF